MEVGEKPCYKMKPLLKPADTFEFFLKTSADINKIM